MIPVERIVVGRSVEASREGNEAEGNPRREHANLRGLPSAKSLSALNFASKLQFDVYSTPITCHLSAPLCTFISLSRRLLVIFSRFRLLKSL